MDGKKLYQTSFTSGGGSKNPPKFRSRWPKPVRVTAVFCAGVMFSSALLSSVQASTNPGYTGTSISERDSVAVVGAPGGLMVNTYIGHWSMSKNVLRIPGRGLPISVDLSYNSNQPDVPGPVGNGWRFSYDLSCKGQKRVVSGTTYVDMIISWGSGRTDLFTDTGSGYVPVKEGVFATLVEQTGNLIVTTKEQIRFVFPKPAANVTKGVTQMIDPNGNALSFAYNSQKCLASVTDASGRTITMSYNSRNRITQIKDGNINPARIAKFEYTGDLLTKYSDIMGTVSQYVYDSKKRISQIADAKGKTDLAYELKYGTVVSITRINLLGSIMAQQTLAFDFGKGNSSITDRIDSTHTATTVYHYDGKKRLDKITDPLGHVTKRTYDAAGNIASISDALGHKSEFTYDAMGNVLTVKDALNHLTVITYDPVFNRVTSVTDPNGHMTQFGFDGRGNLISRTDALGRVTSYARDSYGQTVSRTNARGKTTHFGYNVFGDRTSTTDPLLRTSSAVYDGAGRLVSSTDAKGQTTSYVRDARGSLLQANFADLTSATCTYDADGLMLTAADPSSNLAWSYDSERRVSLSSDILRSKVIAYAYDMRGQRTGMIEPDGNVVGYSYDAAGRLTGINRDGDQFTFNYDIADRRTGLIRPNGTSTAYIYDNADRLLSMIHNGPNPLPGFTYEYDNAGSRTKMTTGGTVTDYGYDFNNQLISETRNGVGGYANLFEYDEVGNRIKLTAGAAVTNSTFDDADQIIAQTGANPATFHHDDNGNMDWKLDSTGVSQYFYDARNRTIKTVTPTGTGDYVLDVLNRRAVKAVGAATTQYEYDGMNAVAEYDGIGALTAQNLFGLGMDENLARYTSGGAFAYHQDGLGSVRGMTNAVGTMVNSYDYDAWGNRSQTELVANDYTFTGRQKDEESGLYYYRARQYDSAKGRFTQLDPIDQGIGTSAYVYVSNNPVNYVDPLGLCRSADGDDGAGRFKEDDSWWHKVQNGTYEDLNDFFGGFGPHTGDKDAEDAGKIGAGITHAILAVEGIIAAAGKATAKGLVLGGRKVNLGMTLSR